MHKNIIKSIMFHKIVLNFLKMTVIFFNILFIMPIIFTIYYGEIVFLFLYLLIPLLIIIIIFIIRVIDEYFDILNDIDVLNFIYKHEYYFFMICIEPSDYKFVNMVCQHDDIKLFKKIFANSNKLTLCDILMKSHENNSYKILNHIHREIMDYSEFLVVHMICMYGKSETLIYYLSNKYGIIIDGSKSLNKLFIENNIDQLLLESALSHSFISKDHSLIEFLIDNVSGRICSKKFSYACLNNDIWVCKFLLSRYHKFDKYIKINKLFNICCNKNFYDIAYLLKINFPSRCVYDYNNIDKIKDVLLREWIECGLIIPSRIKSASNHSN